ncbi:MAG: phosphatase PAP2 family protein [Verrucomicrobia bacterium]|nr:phosphatase PAP2 family protein [Verrucomicrobiota bacterium]
MDGSRDLAQAPARAGCKAGSLTRHYVFIDYATQGYMLLVGLLVLVFHDDRVSGWPLLLAGHAAVIGLVHWLIQAQAARPANKVLEFLRHFYPVLLYTAFYRETGSLNQMFVSGYLDAFFIRLEEQVFHVQPSLAFMEALPYLPVSELFYVSYFSYYVMIAGVGLALFFRNRAQFYHYVSVVSFVFYICYLLYIFLPVMGPRIFFKELTDYNLPDELLPSEFPPEFPAAVQLGPFYRIMALIYHVFEAPGAAFPSSHVAVAIATAFFSYRYLRSIRHLHFVVVVLLCVATVYCRYHYVVDVVAGAVTAALLIPLGNALYFKLSRARE